MAKVAGIEITPMKIVGAFHPGVRHIASQLVDYQASWDDNNVEAARGSGPLMAVVGDSTALGIGASAWERGFLALTLEAMRQASGEPWRLINLAAWGAKVSHVVENQLAMLDELGPIDIVACAAGSNDVLWSLPRARALAQIDRLLAALPSGSYVGQVSRGHLGRWTEPNDRLHLGAARHGHIAVPSWTNTPRSMIGVDGIHPNDAGHLHIAQATVAAMGYDPALLA